MKNILVVVEFTKTLYLEERKVGLHNYGENANVHSQNDSGDLRGVGGGDGK